MFHKILVAVDSSSHSNHVFDAALALAKANQAHLMLLHVLSVEEEGSPSMPISSGFSYYPILNDTTLEVYQSQWRAFEEKGLNLLRRYTETATEAGIPTEFTQTPGSPGRMICEQAKMWGADLIMVGRRGRSGLSELLLGSVSNYVLHHATCSVLTVHAPASVATPASESRSEFTSPTA